MSIFAAFYAHFVGRVATLGLATFLSALFSLMLLPIATTSLHASDYGTYALLTSIVMLISTAMDGGASLFMPAVYHRASAAERASIFSTSAVVAATGGIAVVALAIAAERYFETEWVRALIPADAMIVAALTVPLKSIATITSVIFSITNRTYALALQIFVQAACVFVFTIVALFGLNMGGTSLLVGAAFGQFGAGLVGLIVLHREGELFARPSRLWARRSMRHTLTSSTFGFVGGAHNLAENSLLAGLSGLQAAGLMNHVRLYYNFTLALVGTVGHNVRTASLAEARDTAAGFEATRMAWTPVHMALTGAGLLFALFGEAIVHTVSNGKLDGAAPYIPFFMIVALIQNSGQAATATVYASGKAYIAVRFQIALTLVGLIALYPLIRSFGIAGVVAVIIAESVLYRVSVARLARRLRPIPFQDAVAWFGCLLVTATALWAEFAQPTMQSRLLWMLGGFCLIAIAGRRSIGETIALVLRLAGVKRPSM